MEDTQPSGFKIGLDKPEIEPENGKKKPTPPKTGKKSSNSALFILFLGFLVIAVALVWFYYDIQDRLQTINASGTEEVARLSSEVDTKFAEINNQLSTLAKTLQNDMYKIKSDIRDTNSQIDKLQASIASFEQNLGSLKQNIPALKEQVQKMGSELGEVYDTAQNFKQSQAEIQGRLKAHSESIQTLSEAMVSQDALDKALQKEREFNKQNMAHATEALFSEVASFQDKMKTMRENIDQLEEKITKIYNSMNFIDPRAPGVSPKSESKSSDSMPVPENGEIVEQKIE